MKKRIISALLAVCLLVSLGTVGVFAADSAVTLKVDSVNGTETATREGTEAFKTMEAAIAAAEAGDTIQLETDVTVDVSTVTTKNGAAYVIDKNLTINGNNHTVSVTGSNTNDASVFNVLDNGTSVTFNNLKIDGVNVAKHGVNVFAEAGETVSATLNGVAISGCTGYGVCNTRSSVTATSLTVTAPENAWGAVDVDARDNGASLNLTSSEINGNLVLDSDEKGANTVSLTGGTYATVMTNTYDEAKGEHRSEGTNNITIDGATVETVSLNGTGEDVVKIDDSDVTSIASTNSNTEKLKITINKSDIVNAIPDNIKDNVTIKDSTVGDEPVNNAIAQVGDEYFDNLQDAIDAAVKNSKPVVLLDNITLNVPANTAEKTGAININGNVTIDGNHKTITAGEGFIIKDGTGLYHVINIQGNATVTIKNLSINGANKARSGINVFGDATSAPVVTLTNVDVQNCTTYGVTNGSAKVTASDLTTDDNGWGGVNVDSKNANATFKMTSGTLADNYSVVVGESASHDSVVDLDGGTYNTVQVKVSNTDVNISRGTYGKIELTSGVNKGVVDVTGGTFKTSVSEYVDSSMPYEAKTSSGLYTYHRTPESAADAAGQGGDVNYILGGVTHNVTLYYDKYVQTEIEVTHNYDFELPGGKYDGKEIIGWTRGGVTYKDGDEVEIDRDMTFYVVLKDGEFDITIDSKIKHGTITTNVNSADRGDVVRIYVDPDTGYVLDELKVYTGTNYRTSVKVTYVNDSTYRFTMPGDDVYITATFKANGMPFVDVHRTQWFYDSIYYVWSNDMMEGDSATTFNPDGTMTRAMFWAVLGRMDGQTITGTNWVEQARNWAMREGVSDGTNPNDYVTREQMVTMLWRYAGEKNGSANLNRYTDSGSVSGYAVEAMRWAIGNGVIQGVTSTTLAPKANATRAECATIFMRFDKM